MKKYILIIILFLIFPLNINAKSGCCSWHGGVSYCAENGRYVCNDGTYSPTCTCQPTIKYIYGCTNPNSINYNSNANKDDGSCISKTLGCTNKDAINYDSNANTSDGSCKYETQNIEEQSIPFETKIIDGDIDKIKQEGKEGKKELVYKIVKDESGNIISSTLIEEKVITNPIDEIIIKKKDNQENKNIYNEENSNFYNGLVITLIAIGIFMAKRKNKKNIINK